MLPSQGGWRRKKWEDPQADPILVVRNLYSCSLLDPHIVNSPSWLRKEVNSICCCWFFGEESLIIWFWSYLIGTENELHCRIRELHLFFNKPEVKSCMRDVSASMKNGKLHTRSFRERFWAFLPLHCTQLSFFWNILWGSCHAIQEKCKHSLIFLSFSFFFELIECKREDTHFISEMMGSKYESWIFFFVKIVQFFDGSK